MIEDASGTNDLHAKPCDIILFYRVCVFVCAGTQLLHGHD